MEIRIEVVFVPVTDVDRAKAFYVDGLGFHPDHDMRVDEQTRFVQLTPPGSACSIVIGEGLGQELEAGRLDAIMAVIEDADAFRADVSSRGIQASDVDEQPWGRFVYLSDPDGNAWRFQQLPEWANASPEA